MRIVLLLLVVLAPLMEMRGQFAEGFGDAFVMSWI
jgi:hypothetical protein